MTPAVADDPRTDDPRTEDTAMVRSVGTTIHFGREADNWDAAFRIAKMLANSEYVPKGYQGHPENAVVAMQYGAEVGLRPMASLRSVAVINGMPGLFGDGFLGVIMASPAYMRRTEYYVLASGEEATSLRTADLNQDETRAVAKFWRRGVPDPFVAEFSIADAKRAKLWGKPGPWTEYPARQMRWRARGFAGRDGFAPELRGIDIAEALLNHADVTIDVVPTEPTRPPAPVRRSEKPTVVAATGTSEGTAAPPQPELLPPTHKVIDRILITHTEYVEKAGVVPFYKVEGKVADKLLAYTFVTRDKDLYEIVASCEGTDSELRIGYDEGHLKENDKPSAKAVKILAAVDPMPA